jgi:hypothetical protein
LIKNKENETSQNQANSAKPRELSEKGKRMHPSEKMKAVLNSLLHLEANPKRDSIRQRRKLPTHRANKGNPHKR